MALGFGATQFALNYEIAPITLNNGIAGGVLGGAISIASIIQALSYNGLTSSSAASLQDYFAKFYPTPGSTLQDNQIGNYPFANMAIAANAIINQPLKVSLLMRVPASLATGGYGGKLSIMTALKNTLDQHTQAEGTFTVATPSYWFDNLILLLLTDVSAGETNQAQVEWRFDFIRPLITGQQAAIAENAMMSALSSGGPTDGSLSGTSVVDGQPPTVSSGVQSPASASTGASGIPAALTPGAANALAGAS